VIGKQDILDRAGEWQLRPDVVEKDYVLGWLLAAIAVHPQAGSHWVFKGGTCMKKCHFETYRFSEDLDFSLTSDALYTPDDLRRVLLEVGTSAHELSGVGFPEELVSVRERKDRLGRTTFEAKVGYRGPLATPTPPRVLFDLTRHEPILDPPVRRAVHHAYPDAPASAACVQCYSLEELLAEKTRALVERTRPRDLYDVEFVTANRLQEIDVAQARVLFAEKCRAKAFEPPSRDQIETKCRTSEELRAEWGNMLAHQLPLLPPIDDVLTRLADALAWLGAAPAPAEPAVASGRPGEELVAPAGVTYWGGRVPVESLRFAGANRLRVAFEYHGKSRIAEPYSLRRAPSGKLLLYAWERGGSNIKSFDVAEIVGLRPTTESFIPRFRVELTTTAPLRIAPTAPKPTSADSGRRSGTRSKRGYVYECSVCGRRFRRAKYDARIRPHKYPRDSTRCYGRYGVLVSRP
jgi:predicted nucleotidyltransferase component of viral defense system